MFDLENIVVQPPPAVTSVPNPFTQIRYNPKCKINIGRWREWRAEVWEERERERD